MFTEMWITTGFGTLSIQPFRRPAVEEKERKELLVIVFYFKKRNINSHIFNFSQKKHGEPQLLCQKLG